MEGPYHELRVTRVVRETPDARSFVLDIPAEQRDAFAYRAGQFLTFRVPVSGQRLVRCYSLASSPDIDTDPKVTVKRVDDGRVSNWMNDEVQAGDTLEVMKPAGLFCLTERDASLVLLSGGSGITPVISLIKTALATTRRPVKLIYANRDRDSVIFDTELAALAARNEGRFELVHRLDEVEGFVDAAAVCDYVGPDRGADFYVCGPGPFMDTVEAALGTLGIPGERIFIERFEYDSPESAPARPEEAGSEAGNVVVVTLEGETREIPWAPGQTVVQAARAAGLEPPTACEEGFCACCMAQLEEGEGQMKANDVLGERELGEGWVLTCQFVPSSPRIRVRYPD